MTNDERELTQDVILRVQGLEVAWMKEMLWRMAVGELVRRGAISDESVFAKIEDDLRRRWPEIAGVAGAAPIMQDALVEFRQEARRLLHSQSPTVDQP